MKQFTCTEETLKFAHPDTGALVVMHKGDSLSLPDNTVDDFCADGWGTCPDSETGERKEGVKKLKVEKTSNEAESVKIGG